MATSVMITTSAGSAVSRLRVTPTVPKASATVWPVSFSNPFDSSVTMARTAPALSTLISAASARLAQIIRIAAASHHPIPLVAPLMVCLRGRAAPAVAVLARNDHPVKSGS
jgi:hypothetical protein